MAFFCPQIDTNESAPECMTGGQGCPPRSGGHPLSPSLSISNNYNGEPSDELHKLTGMHKRSAHVLYLSVKELERQYGLDYLLFMTLTFGDDVQDQKEAKRRLRNLLNGIIYPMFPVGVWCVERMEQGRLHYHLVCVSKVPVRGNFDFEAFYQAEQEYAQHKKSAKFYSLTKRYGQTALPGLSSLWELFKCPRKMSKRPKDKAKWYVLEKYGFGRSQITPIRASNPEQIARYVGKYVGKHVGQRIEKDKGARLHARWGFDYAPAVCKFTWSTPNGWLWRKKLERFAMENGVSDYRGLQEKWGQHWAWLLQETIMKTDIKRGVEAVVYPSVEHWEADNGPWPEWQERPVGPIVHPGHKDTRPGEARMDPIWIEHEDEPLPIRHVSQADRDEAERHQAETGAALRREVLMNPMWVRSGNGESIADREARRRALWLSWQRARPDKADLVRVAISKSGCHQSGVEHGSPVARKS